MGWLDGIGRSVKGKSKNKDKKALLNIQNERGVTPPSIKIYDYK